MIFPFYNTLFPIIIFLCKQATCTCVLIQLKLNTETFQSLVDGSSRLGGGSSRRGLGLVSGTLGRLSAGSGSGRGACRSGSVAARSSGGGSGTRSGAARSSAARSSAARRGSGAGGSRGGGARERSGNGGGSRAADAALAADARHGRRLAGGLGGKGDNGGGIDLCDELGLYEDGNDLAGGEAERAVVQDAEDAGNLARVAGQADPGAGVVGEDVVNDLAAAGALAVAGLALALGGAAPELVGLGEALLEAEVGEHAGNGGLVGAAIAGVDGDALAEELLDDGGEGEGGGRGQVAKGGLGSLSAAGERGAVVGLKGGHAALLPAVLEEGVCLVGLDEALVGELGVGPGGGAVAVELGPVALQSETIGSAKRSEERGEMAETTYVPGRSAIVGLGGVVEALAVAAHDHDLVSHIAVLAAAVVEIRDPAGEALPLGLGAVLVVGLVRGERSLNQTKVVGQLDGVSISFFFFS